VIVVEAVGVSDLDVEGTEPESFDVFFASEYRSIVAFATMLCGRRSIAEELAQEAFFRAFRRWATVGSYEDPGAWVRRVVANMATSSWRTRAREAKALARLWRRPRPAEPEAADDGFWIAVRSLPVRQAQCLTLHYLEDRAVDDISRVLGIAPATVRVHLHQGRRTLAARLGDVLDEEKGT
jgi:RNA polymerase sigma-70 factor, ECF subfamily